MRKSHLALLVIALLAGAIYWLAAIPATSTPRGEQSQARYRPGPYAVINEDFRAVDRSRETPANGDIPARPQRELAGEIWRPANLPAPGPLVVYSHGFMSYHREALYLVRFLASHGYTVVAVDYPLTGMMGEGHPLVTDLVNQPADISFLIDRLLARNSVPDDPLYGSIDPQRIAAAGISLGGLTSTMAGFQPGAYDPRFGAVVSMAGPSSFLTRDFFNRAGLPYLLVAGDTDAIVAYRDNMLPLLEKHPGTLLVTLKDASHAGFVQQSATIMRFLDNPDGFACRAVLAGIGDADKVQEESFMQVMGGADAGFDTGSKVSICESPLPPVAMRGARQHMFATLAVHAFLDSVFAKDAAVRQAAGDYLLHGLAAENPREVSVTRSPAPVTARPEAAAAPRAGQAAPTPAGE